MNARTTVILTVAVLAAMVGIIPAVASGGGANPEHVTVLDGADRYETAALVALSANPDTHGAVQTLYIANGETLVDAITVGLTNEGPSAMLLVTRDTVPDATADALRQIAHAELVFLGGDDVISPAVRAEVESLTDNYAYPN